MLAHAYNIIIDSGVGSPVHVREVFDGLNINCKWFLLILITTLQLPSTSSYNSHTAMHTSTVNTDIILAR